MKTDALYYGDCLEVMKKWPDECVDLIYLDPPFNSKVNYNILFGTGKGKEKVDLAQLTAFTDTWQWNEEAQQRVKLIKNAVAHPAHRTISAFDEIYPDGSGMLSYLSYMAERLAEMRRLLKNTGGIYLHCDPTASHYLKIIMDEIFEVKNFQNEIVWWYSWGVHIKRRWNRKHDIILFYSKNYKRLFFDGDRARVPYREGSMMTTDKKWNRSYNKAGKLPEDVFDIATINAMSKERLGYPTQKPIALLERIVKASSNEGDVVLDPFCGCGTTIEAALKLKRKWVGIDISTYAIEVIRRERLKNNDIPLYGVPKDFKAAKDFARNKPFDFEKWAVTRIHGFAPNTVQRGDGGIDGRGMIHNPAVENGLCIAQVKGGSPHVNDLRAFCGSLVGGKAAMGIFITLDKWDTPTVRQCIADAGKLSIGATKYNRLVMYSIREHFSQVKPDLPPLAHPLTGHPLQEDVTDLQDSIPVN